MKFPRLFIVAATMASRVKAVPLTVATYPNEYVETNAKGSKTPPIHLLGRGEEGGYDATVEVTVDGYTVNKDGNYMYMEFDPNTGSMVSSGLQVGIDNPETDKSKTTGKTLDKHEHENKPQQNSGNVMTHLRRLIDNIKAANGIPNERSHINRRKAAVVLGSKVDFGRANSYGIACGGAISIGVYAIVHSNIVTTGALNIADGSMVCGDVDAFGAVSLGSNANFNGTVISQGAVNIAENTGLPLGIFTGDIYSTGQITTGANSKVIGNIYACSAYTAGSLSSITGQVLMGSFALPVPSSNNTKVYDDVLTAYSNLMSKTAGGIDLDASIINNTLLPGIYKTPYSWAFTAGKTLTFSGTSSDTWIIQIGAGVEFAGNIALTGGALPSNIQWVSVGIFSIGTNSIFYGTIVSTEPINVAVGASLHGLLYSTAGTCNLGAGVRFADTNHEAKMTESATAQMPTKKPSTRKPTKKLTMKPVTMKPSKKLTIKPAAPAPKPAAPAPKPTASAPKPAAPAPKPTAPAPKPAAPAPKPAAPAPKPAAPAPKPSAPAPKPAAPAPKPAA